MEYKKEKELFLKTALPDIPFDGWSDDLMERTSKKLKISNTKVSKIFPQDYKDLVLFFFEYLSDKTIEKFNKLNTKDMRVRDKISEAVKIRFKIAAENKEAFALAIKATAHPSYRLQLPKLIWSAADKIWWAAGDTSTDYNHYTKRLLLSGVITASTFYWLNDNSANNEQVNKFIDRRIENVLQLGKTVSKFKARA